MARYAGQLIAPAEAGGFLNSKSLKIAIQKIYRFLESIFFNSWSSQKNLGL